MSEVARKALREVGREHLNAATILIAVCPRRRHQLARLVSTSAGTVYTATVRSARLHAAARRASTEGLSRTEATFEEVLEQLWEHDDLPSACACRSWPLKVSYLLELAATRPSHAGGVPRVPIDATRTEES